MTLVELSFAGFALVGLLGIIGIVGLSQDEVLKISIGKKMLKRKH